MKNLQPNIIFVQSDQHRFCDVGYAGNTEIATPNLDRLAREGACFTQMYSNCPLCVPARGSLLTGLHGLQHGAAANDLPIKPSVVSVADRLNDLGYYTAHIGKWHLGGTPRDQFITHYNRLGFQYWRGYECNHSYYNGYYETDSNLRYKIKGYAPWGETDLALDFMRQMKEKTQPFAVFLNFSTPHDPYLQVPEEEFNEIQNRGVHFRENVKEPPLEGETFLEKYDLKKYYIGYYAHIQQIDHQIGRLQAYLKENGLEDNTIFVYTSDHGDMLGSHGYLNKQMYFDESTRVPFVIWWRNHIVPGKRSQLLSTVDIAPSLLGLLNSSFEEETAGCDCSEAMRDPEAAGQEEVYLYSYVPCHQAKNRKVGSWRAVNNGEFLLVADQLGKPLCLYHTAKDTMQMKNVLNEQQYLDKQQELKAILDRYVTKYDGYIRWEDLLAQNGLKDLWRESEEFFATFFKK